MAQIFSLDPLGLLLTQDGEHLSEFALVNLRSGWMQSYLPKAAAVMREHLSGCFRCNSSFMELPREQPRETELALRLRHSLLGSNGFFRFERR